MRDKHANPEIVDLYIGDKKIKRNAIKCKSCGEIIVSEEPLFTKWCKCGGCCVDGGDKFIRRLYFGPYEELIEYESH